MSSLDMQTQQGMAEQEQPGTAQAQAPLQTGQSPSMGTVPGLPPTALSMQAKSLNDQYQQAQQQQQMQQMGGGGQMLGSMGAGGGLGNGEFGRTSLTDMAERLARSYGLDFGRGSLVDQQGQFMQTPDQMAGAGGNLADTAASMDLIAKAIADRRVEGQQNKATAALQAGQGQIQSRGRGSLAGMQSNFYAQMAANYTNPNLLPEQQDFSYWLQKGQMENEEAALGDGSTGGGGSGSNSNNYGGAGVVTNRSPGSAQPYRDQQYLPPRSTDSGPQGKGDVVTTGPNAGKRPVYTYDPINQTTTVSWEKA